MLWKPVFTVNMHNVLCLDLDTRVKSYIITNEATKRECERETSRATAGLDRELTLQPSTDPSKPAGG